MDYYSKKCLCVCCPKVQEGNAVFVTLTMIVLLCTVKLRKTSKDLKREQNDRDPKCNNERTLCQQRRITQPPPPKPTAAQYSRGKITLF
eukprot:2081265-Amphidinium_carterae.1